MNLKIKIFLIKKGFISINQNNIENWVKNLEFDILDFVFDNSDFWKQKDIINSLKDVKNDRAINIIEKGLDSKILPVFKSAVKAIQAQGLYSKYSLKIETILKRFKKKEAEFKKNWSKPPKMSKLLYIDKSEMVRLKQLKALLAKPKSSMSIG